MLSIPDIVAAFPTQDILATLPIPDVNAAVPVLAPLALCREKNSSMRQRWHVLSLGIIL
jgi:hypothetical protein